MLKNIPEKYPELRVHTENIISFWKKYLNKLENKPYPQLTTKELEQITGSSHLTEGLEAIDKVIYGNSERQNVITAMKNVTNFTDQLFKEKIEKLRHANND